MKKTSSPGNNESELSGKKVRSSRVTLKTNSFTSEISGKCVNVVLIISVFGRQRVRTATKLGRRSTSSAPVI